MRQPCTLARQLFFIKLGKHKENPSELQNITVCQRGEVDAPAIDGNAIHGAKILDHPLSCGFVNARVGTADGGGLCVYLAGLETTDKLLCFTQSVILVQSLVFCVKQGNKSRHGLRISRPIGKRKFAVWTVGGSLSGWIDVQDRATGGKAAVQGLNLDQGVWLFENIRR